MIKVERNDNENSDSSKLMKEKLYIINRQKNPKNCCEKTGVV
jgi:hypothetical protein